VVRQVVAATRPALEFAVATHPYLRLRDMLAAGFGGPAIGAQVAWNLLFALAFFLLSWATFGNLAREERAAAPWRLAAVTTGSWRRWLRVGRVWGGEPFGWKTFHFLAGGRLFCWLRWVGLSLYALGIASIGYSATSVAYELVGMVIWLAALEGVYYASRIFREEMRWGTLPTLTLLPMSPGGWARRMAVGLVPALLPYAVSFIAGVLMAPEPLLPPLSAVFHPFGVFMLCEYVAFVCFVAECSLRYRHMALVRACAFWFVGNMAVGMLLVLLLVPAGGGGLMLGLVLMVVALIAFAASSVLRTGRLLERRAGEAAGP